MKQQKISALTTIAFATAMALSACGGGGGGNSGSSSSSGGAAVASGASSTSTTVTGTVATPQYTASSAQSAIFTQLNAYRQQCGFPALQENTVLDTAAANHAKYMGLNNVMSDSETSGNLGYTGATYIARAAYAGFPSTATGLGVSGVYATLTSSFSSSAAGQQLMYGWLGGVYHANVAAYPVDTIGIGENETQYTDSSGYKWTQAWGTLSLLNTQTQTLSNTPLTFPCQGVTGVPYKEVGETPTPPNVSGSGWGTPVVVMGNPTDTIVLQSGTMTDTSGTVINLQVLNSSTDPNKELPAFEAVAYSSSPLSPNTQYTVSVTGTVNGTAFSRSFSFTTGNGVG